MSAMTNHYAEPKRLDRAFNAAVRWLTDRGVNLAGAQTLTVTGRTSGSPQSTPVNPIRVGDGEFLVSPRGNTQWARNVRLDPSAQLRRGRRTRAVRLRELTDHELKATVIADYLRRWGWEVGRFLPAGLTPKSDAATIREYADALPVFAVGSTSAD
jgi:deazaflavin-dependent oxidoreductase (nitroreductase family)